MSDILSRERIERIGEYMTTAFERSGDSQGYCLDTALAESVDDLLRERDALLGLLKNIWEWSDARGTINEVEWRKRLMPRIEAALTKTGRLT